MSNIYQKPGTGSSAEGIFASQCGYPINIMDDSNSYNNILLVTPSKPLMCLGDVLKDIGYDLTLILPSSAQFSGLSSFFNDHGFTKIKDINTLKFDDSDKSIFGLNDHYILQSLLKEIDLNKLSGKPYYLVSSTIDTHFPGYVDKRFDVKLSEITLQNSLLSNSQKDIFLAAKLLDKMLADFIKKAMQTDPNLIIFLMPDHMSPGSKPWKDRKLFALAIGGEEVKLEGLVDNYGTHFDIPSTILDILKINTDFEIGLGKNLIKNKSIFTKSNEEFTWDAPDNEFTNIVSSLRPYIKSIVSSKIDCSNGIQYIPKGEKIIIGNRVFNNIQNMTNNEINTSAKNKYLFVSTDINKEINKALWLYDKQEVVDLMHKNGGLLVGNISEVNSLCRQEISDNNLMTDRELCKISPFGILIRNRSDEKIGYYRALNRSESHSIDKSECEKF
jgi:hypothetical protein